MSEGGSISVSVNAQRMMMANLTISVDDEVLKRARIRALEENSSVNAVLGRYLEEYARTADLPTTD